MSYQSNVTQTVRVQDLNLQKNLESTFLMFASYVKHEHVFIFGAHIIHLFRRFRCSFGYLLLTVLVIS